MQTDLQRKAADALKSSKSAVTRLCKAGAEVARQNVRKRSGLLAKAIGIKVGTKNNLALGKVGVRKGFAAVITSSVGGAVTAVKTQSRKEQILSGLTGKTAKTLNLKGNAGFKLTGLAAKHGKLEDPQKIAHLIELGHGGPHPAGAFPFLAPAGRTIEAQATAVINEEIKKGLAATP